MIYTRPPNCQGHGLKIHLFTMYPLHLNTHMAVLLLDRSFFFQMVLALKGKVGTTPPPKKVSHHTKTVENLTIKTRQAEFSFYTVARSPNYKTFTGPSSNRITSYYQNLILNSQEMSQRICMTPKCTCLFSLHLKFLISTFAPKDFKQSSSSRFSTYVQVFNGIENDVFWVHF